MTASLTDRRTNYEALAYYSDRADAALVAGDMVAFEAWAGRYHALRLLLEGAR